jgi:hypothetical protein
MLLNKPSQFDSQLIVFRLLEQSLQNLGGQGHILRAIPKEDFAHFHPKRWEEIFGISERQHRVRKCSRNAALADDIID